MSVDHSILNIDQLTFLFESNHGTLLNQMRIEEKRFFGITDMIKQRTKLHVEEVQSRLSDSNLSSDVGATLGEIKNVIGVDRYKILLDLTDNIVTQTDDTIAFTMETCEELGEVLKEIYPRSKIMTMEHHKYAT